ncbi:MAG TPA: polysaccharide deacetylase family protein [Burkholderiaceae bacterium]|nr:polysaccharide deacetylase family protein [Burkholderiaceae bacterium]
MTAPARALAAAALAALAVATVPAGAAAPGCKGTVYLTLDTGNMAEAERIAGILRRHDVRATFFLANERTPAGDHSLDDRWAGYWRERVREGHAFGSHTFDHVYFRGTGPDGRIVAVPQFGANAGRRLAWDGAALCGEIGRVGERFAAMTGARLDPVWRAPGGKAPPAAMAAARGCGWSHVHWAPAGFLGDELPSETHPNDRLLKQALASIRDGDVLMAHLGIWSRKDPWAPTLDPLIGGLKARGLCFATLREHPDHRR